MSFVPSQSAKFNDFAPGLFITYIIRLFIGIGLVLLFPQFITMAADYTYEKDRGKGVANLILCIYFFMIRGRISVPSLRKT